VIRKILTGTRSYIYRASAIEVISNIGSRQGRSLRNGGVGVWGMRSKWVTERRAIIAGIAGNVMEWYDFSVYGYFATNIGRHFFPAQDTVSSLIAAFGVFAAGFLMRPLGSLVFGHIGDKMGRKMALTTSVALMAIPTFLIGSSSHLSANRGDGLGVARPDAAVSRAFGRR
jgi:MFS family permease